MTLKIKNDNIYEQKIYPKALIINTMLNYTNCLKAVPHGFSTLGY